ncbi:MAG: response regulator [Elusimicrobiota bacterium]
MNKNKFKIIVADGDKDIRFLVKVYLRDYDVEIIEAINGKQCLDLIKRHLPDLVILNFMMDKMTGYQVSEAIYNNEKLRDIPVIIMTLEGFDLIEQRKEVDEYLAKPFNRNQFMKAIKRTLDDKIFTEIRKKKKTKTIDNQTLKKATNKPGKKGKRKKILIADDEPSVIKMLNVILRGDFDVDCVACGEDLVKKVDEQDYDLIISDVVMPKLSGWKSIKKIREMGYDIPVVFSSGLVKDQELYETLKPEGRSRFLLKPFGREELMSAVRDLLE